MSYMLAPPCAIYTCLWEKPQMRDRGEPEALSEALQDGSREIGRVKHGQGDQELQRKRGERERTIVKFAWENDHVYVKLA